MLCFLGSVSMLLLLALYCFSPSTQAIDKELSRSQKSRIHERKLQLLTEEERIENDMEAKSKAKLKPLKFTAKINVKFFDCAACCGPQIIGCYAPNGDHCERPLEIGACIKSC